MSVTSGFFNSINGDKKYNADDINEYYKGILDDGVVKYYDADLEVEAGSDMTVNVMGGKAICLGKYIKNTGVLELAIEPSESQPRYDAVVVGVDLENRSANIYVKKGTAAADPSYPTIVDTDLNKELCLAYVYVSANATSVTVIDTRSDATICGYVRLSEVETIPTINYTYDVASDKFICDKTYAEILNLTDPIVNIKNYNSYLIKGAAIRHIGDGNLFEITGLTSERYIKILHTIANVISFTDVAYITDMQSDIVDLKQTTQSLTNGITLTRNDLHDLENNKVNPLWNMRWKDGGNVTDTDGIFVPWSNGAASTVLILCMNNSDDRCCQVFLARKTMSSAQRAIRLAGASDTLGVYASISQSQGVLVALADDVTPYPTGAQIYYQYIEL